MSDAVPALDPVLFEARLRETEAQLAMAQGRSRYLAVVNADLNRSLEAVQAVAIKLEAEVASMRERFAALVPAEPTAPPSVAPTAH